MVAVQCSEIVSFGICYGWYHLRRFHIDRYTLLSFYIWLSFLASLDPLSHLAYHCSHCRAHHYVNSGTQNGIQGGIEDPPSFLAASTPWLVWIIKANISFPNGNMIIYFPALSCGRVGREWLLFLDVCVNKYLTLHSFYQFGFVSKLQRKCSVVSICC